MGLLVVVFYVSSLDNSFILGDLDAIVNNRDVIDPGGWQRLWWSDFWSSYRDDEKAYRPITILSFWANAQLTGLSPIAFRLVNMALLGLLGWLIAAWLMCYVPYQTVAWLCAALFVAHPTNAEAVNHIVGRADLLAMVGIVGFLLSQRLMLKGAMARRPDQTAHQRAQVHPMFFSAVGLLCAVVAMLSKDTGLLLIPMAVMQGYVAHGKPRKGPRPSLGLLWRVHVVTTICLAIPLTWFIWGCRLVDGLAPKIGGTSVLSEMLDINANPLLGEGFIERLPSAFSLAWFYAWQLVKPVMTYSHTPNQLPTMANASAILGVFVVVALVAVLARTAYRRHWLCLAAVMALGQWVMVCHLWKPQSVYASNLMVMPFTLAAVMAVSGAMVRMTKGSMRKRTVTVIPAVAVILLMFWSVLYVNSRWFSTARLMATDLSLRPGNAVSMYNYGAALVRAGAYDSAVYWLDEAVDRRPQWVQARRLLALVWYTRGQFTEATHQYQRVVELNPDDLHAHLQLAMLALQDHNLDTAGKHLEIAKGLSPQNAKVVLAEARVAGAQRNWALAREKYEAVLSVNPAHEAARRERDELLDKLDQRQSY